MKKIKIAAAGMLLSCAFIGSAIASPLADRLSAVSEGSGAARAAQTPEAAWAGAGQILDGTTAVEPAPVVVQPVGYPRKTGLAAGLKNGARAGAWVGFGGTLSPAVALLSEGLDRKMSRSADGRRSGNNYGGWYFGAGLVLAVLLYIPALVIGAVFAVGGGAAGGVSELVKAGSTERWDGEAVLD